MDIAPRAGWIPYSPRPVSSVAVSHVINANLIRKYMNGGPDIIIAAGPLLKAPDGHLPTKRIVLSYSLETCENSLSGIKSSRRRSIGGATLAGRNRKAHQRPVFIAGAFFVPAMLRHGGGARDTFGCAGLLSSRSANPRTAATLTCLAASGGSSITKGTHA